MTINMFKALALVLLLPLAACGQGPQGTSQAGAANHSAQVGDAPTSSMISRKIQTAMQQAKLELATKNIDINNIHVGDDQGNKDSLPEAEITPQGDLLIAGTKVTATPEQRELLLDYRQQILGIADAGMDIGTQGADLGIQATKAALWGAISGRNDKDIEASIKPQTDQIQAAALKLCKRLPDLLASQQKLAAQMPAFKPYATMDQKDIDDCGKEMTDKNGKKGFAVFSD